MRGNRKFSPSPPRDTARRRFGEKLFISPKTVDTYRSRIMEKLGLNHRGAGAIRPPRRLLKEL